MNSEYQVCEISFFREYVNDVPYIYRRRANNLQDFCSATKLGNQDTTLTPSDRLGYSLIAVVLPPTLAISQRFCFGTPPLPKLKHNNG
jgi:hypothetical protein